MGMEHGQFFAILFSQSNVLLPHLPDDTFRCVKNEMK